MSVPAQCLSVVGALVGVVAAAAQCKSPVSISSGFFLQAITSQFREGGWKCTCPNTRVVHYLLVVKKPIDCKVTARCAGHYCYSQRTQRAGEFSQLDGSSPRVATAATNICHQLLPQLWISSKAASEVDSKAASKGLVGPFRDQPCRPFLDQQPPQHHYRMLGGIAAPSPLSEKSCSLSIANPRALSP